MTVTFRRLDPGRFGPWALVTGASSGIGREFARQLAANGIDLVLAARRASVLGEVGADLADRYGIRYRCLPVDLARTGACDRIVAATDDLDIGLVVSNAGRFIVCLPRESSSHPARPP